MEGSAKSKFSLSKLIQCSITLVMGLFTLIALCFPLLKVSTYIDGIIPATISENGFAFLDMKSVFIPEDFQWGAVLSGTFCVLQLVAAVSAIVMAILAFFVFNAKASKILCKIFMIVCLCCHVTYLITGIVNASIPAAIGYWVQGLGVLDSDVTSGTTFAYIPLRLGGMIFAGYIVSSKVIKDGAVPARRARPAAEESGQSAEGGAADAARIAEALKTYKELLDAGIITQEEFDREKEKLLQ